MLADGLTKEDPFRGNGALEHFLRTGVLSFVDMEAELERRRSSTDAKSRSAKASLSRLQYEDQLHQLCSLFLETLQSTPIGGAVEAKLRVHLAILTEECCHAGHGSRERRRRHGKEVPSGAA